MPILTPAPLKTNIPFVANTTQKIDLPRNRFMRRILLRLEVKTTNAAAGPTLTEDNPMSLIKRIRVIKNGSDTDWDIPLAWRWYILKYIVGTEPERVQTSTVANAVSTAIAMITIDFATDEKNDEDISALVQAHGLTEFKLEVDWGDNTNLATANPPTIDTTNTFIKVSVEEVDLTDDDLNTLRPSATEEPRILNKRQTMSEFAVDIQAFNNFNFSKDIKVGALVQYHAIFAIDNNIRSDTLVDTYRFRQESIKKDLDTQVWAQSQARDKKEFSLESVIRGLTFMNWVKKGLLDLTGAKQGDLKYEMNSILPTGAAGTVKIQLVQTELL